MTIALSSLKESNEFLNLLMDNMTSAVFLVNKHVRIQQFNDAFQKLFAKEESALIDELCGNALGCSFVVDQGKDCGDTTNCGVCELRSSLLRAFIEKTPTFKSRLRRRFLIGTTKIEKYFLFSAMYLPYHDEEMILVIVDDLTEIETQRLDLLEKQRLVDEDLKSAAGIQRSLLPALFPAADTFRFGARFIPCDRVGGDMFNVVQLDEDHIVLYILDVSGHGVPAALVTVSVSQMLNPTTGYFCDREGAIPFSCTTGLASPRHVLEALDENYPVERFDKYFTMGYAVLNVRDMSLLSCNAGHPPAVVLRADGHIELLETGGTIVGLGGIIPFEEETKTLRCGDKVIWYTDGLTEYADACGEEFGVRRMHETLRALRGCSAQEIADRLVGAVLDFGRNNNPGDDITLLVLECLGR